MHNLEPAAILDGLRTRWLGQRIVYHETVNSTNSVAKTLAEQAGTEGTLVIAEEQTAGRGRLGRMWLAPRGTSLLFSLLFRPDLSASRTPALNMICGLGIRQAIRELLNLPAQLKWPNDITVRGRKLGGILTEMSTTGKRVDYVIIGIGLNVNLTPAMLPREFNATSISQELGRKASRLLLLQAVLWHIEQRYTALCHGKWPAQEWASALETLGRCVSLRTSQGTWRGVATGIDDEGALMVRLNGGQSRRVLVGDIMPADEPTGEGPAAGPHIAG